MLDYAPDGFAADAVTPLGQELTAIWQGETVPDEGVLAHLLAVSRASIAGSIYKTSAGRHQDVVVFSPERVSGFCASC